MENDLKYLDGKEYLAIKKVKNAEKLYTIYFDTNTQTNVLICNDAGDIIKDKLIIKEIMDANFLKASDILSSNFDDKHEDDYEYYEEGTEKNHDVSYPRENIDIILKNIKKIFYDKFGNDVLTSQQLDERLKVIKTICLSRSLKSGENSIGEWDAKEGIIRILSKDLDTNKINNFIIFHEAIHAITFLNGQNGAQKYIGVDDDSHEYGKGINEGIVSYIENMEKSKKWQKFKTTGSYDEQRRIIGQIAMLYDNINFGGEHNFIEQYIIDPGNALGRINEIFEEKCRGENPNLTDREYSLYSMRASLNFILKLDDIILAQEPKDRKNLLAECERILVDLYTSQIRKIEIKSLEHLYEILYNIEGFNQNLTQRNQGITSLIQEKIRGYQEKNPDVTLNEIIESLPVEVSTSPEITREERLMMAIFGEMSCDPRYEAIIENIEEMQTIEAADKGAGTISKSQIGRAFGISVPVEIKDEVEGYMRQEIQQFDEKNNGGKTND